MLLWLNAPVAFVVNVPVAWPNHSIEITYSAYPCLGSIKTLCQYCITSHNSAVSSS